MYVLVTNDDGIYTDGIYALARSIAHLPETEVLIAAPERQRSACGHALTLHRPVNANQVELRGLEGVQAWAVSGTPADCVKLAVGALCKQKPDIVVSGINAGPNLATDVLYSGTVSAAMEGAIQGLPAVAVSLADYADLDYEPAAEFAAAFVDNLSGYDWPLFTVFNVNVPAVARKDITDVRFTKMGIARADDKFERRVDPWGRTYFWLQAERMIDGWASDSDVKAVQDNSVSITPLQIDVTHRGFADITGSCPLPKLPWRQEG